MRPNEKLEAAIRWHSPLEQPFQISGLAWFHQERKYRRLPTLPAGAVPGAVDHLANHTAVRVKLKGKANMVHMPATGQCGVDCYVGAPDVFGPLRYGNTTKYNVALTEYECALFTGWGTAMRNIVLNLPLYQGIEEISVGLDENASVAAPPRYASGKKVVVYGTSITQGGCASRPGMAYTNILSRGRIANSVCPRRCDASLVRDADGTQTFRAGARERAARERRFEPLFLRRLPFAGRGRLL